MSRAVSSRVGLYFALLQLVFGLTWVGYVIYLPQLAARAGIARGIVPWILVSDQVIFALSDWAVGIAADRVARVVGRLGKVIAAVTAVSTLAFLLLPFAARCGGGVFVWLVLAWAITSSALRAPPLALLGRYTPADRQPWVGALFVIGAALSTALTPFVTAGFTAYDPRIWFGLSAFSVLAVTLSIVWAERTLANATTPEPEPPSEIRFSTLAMFLAAVLLLQAGFQVYSFVSAQPLFARYANGERLSLLLSLFWAAFTLIAPLASVLVRRFGGATCMTVGAATGAASAWVAAQGTDVVTLGVAHVVAGGAWGCVMVSAVAAALTIGRDGREGTAVGAFFSVVAVATMGRIALVAAHDDQVPAVASALRWFPVAAWLAAAFVLLPVARRMRQRRPGRGASLPSSRAASGRQT